MSTFKCANGIYLIDFKESPYGHKSDDIVSHTQLILKEKEAFQSSQQRSVD